MSKPYCPDSGLSTADVAAAIRVLRCYTELADMMVLQYAQELDGGELGSVLTSEDVEHFQTLYRALECVTDSIEHYEDTRHT